MKKHFAIQWKIKRSEAGMLIREYLKEIQGISKTSLTDIKFNGGGISVNNEPVNVRHILKEGDNLEVLFPAEKPSTVLQGEKLPIDITYEDEHILVVNKPPNMAVLPSKDHRSGTLANAIIYYFNQNDIQSTIHFVNRLDRDTSGLLIIAKHRYAHHLFSLEQQKGLINRKYEAICHGKLEQGSGTINAPIGRKDGSIIEREVRKDGQRAVTHFNVIQQFVKYTWVAIKLETGRTHQIRVHFSNLEHPLVGDNLYGGLKDTINRQALHSKEVSFHHPLLKKDFYFSAKLPDDMRKIVQPTS